MSAVILSEDCCHSGEKEGIPVNRDRFSKNKTGHYRVRLFGCGG
jgi:hypothetical protein